MGSVGSQTLRRSTTLLKIKVGSRVEIGERRYLSRHLLRPNIWEHSDKIFGKYGSVPPEANAGFNNGGKLPTAGEVGRSVDESYRRKTTEQLHHLGCLSKTGEAWWWGWKWWTSWPGCPASWSRPWSCDDPDRW